jgi:hypothetical protein
MNDELLALETDYLISRFGAATATGLSELADKQAVRGWLKGFDHEVLRVGRVFTNPDGSTGRSSLGCGDLSRDGERGRRSPPKTVDVEDYHQSLTSNTALAKSPTRTLRTPQNPVLLTICAVFTLERLTMAHPLNHFGLRAKLYVKAIQQAFRELARLTPRNIS